MNGAIHGDPMGSTNHFADPMDSNHLGTNSSTAWSVWTGSGWWFQELFLFSIIYGIILPIDFHIFQDG